MRALLLLLLLSPITLRAEAVRIPGPDGIILNGELFPAQGRARGPGIVALHGCNGPSQNRDTDWARRLAALGHTVLLPDSFGSRGLASQCSARTRPVTAGGKRREDALAALRWLAARPGTPPGGLVLLGWADGGTTALITGRVSPEEPTGLIRGLVAFYPACRTLADLRRWEPAVPATILMGEADATSCHALADRVGPKLTLTTFAGPSRNFDAPPAPGRRNLPTAAELVEAAAREDAQRRVPAFIAALPPAP